MEIVLIFGDKTTGEQVKKEVQKQIIRVQKFSDLCCIYSQKKKKNYYFEYFI
jgi:hypothetical protein